MKRQFFTAVILILSLNLFSQTFVNEISSVEDFSKLSGLPLSEKYGQVSAIKVVYDLRSNELYFINSGSYRLHYDFCTYELKYNAGLPYFNAVNYSDNNNRRFLLANIDFFKALNVYAMEVSPVDLISVPEIEKFYRIISAKCFFGDSLLFFVNSARLLDSKSKFGENIKLLYPEDIYKNLRYQAVAVNENCGVLKFVHDLNDEIYSLTDKDIIVIDESPLYIPNVAGVIVSEFQTPLSHLCVLGQNRKIPICAIKNAFDDSLLVSLQDEKVCLNVTNDSMYIYKTDKLNYSSGNKKSISLKYDLSVDSLVNIENLNNRAYKFCGNKASNFGILYKLSQKNNFKTPESAFVIPFYFYAKHSENSGAQFYINDLILRKDSLTTDSIKIILEIIRDKIIKAEIDSNLLNCVNNKIISLGNYTRMRFRSSTNAEDADGFSGAGLYTSKTGDLNDSKKPVDVAIKKVWASLWSYQAFMEREYFNINHSEVYMGILVHRSFPDEDVNGVAITKNLYRKDNYGFVINAQLGDVNVVSGSDGEICDQFICFPEVDKSFYSDRNAIDIITTSSLNNGKLVMSSDEILNLANQLEIIKRHFYYRAFTNKTYLEYGLDLEFKIDGANRDLYIKQVRLYND